MKRGRSSSKEKEVSSDSSSSEEEVAVKKKKSPATKKKAKTAASPAKKKAKTSSSDTEGKKKQKTKKEAASPAKKKTTAAKKATPTKRKTKKQKEAEAAAAAAGPVEEWKELPWTYTSFLPTSRLQAHCQAVDKKKEGYVSLQQFKRILSAILPMAEFSGKKELDRITATAESLVRKGFVPYTLFKASASTSSTAPVLLADDPVEIFKRGLKTNPKSITPEQMDAIKEDERQLAKLKQQHLLHSLAKKEKHSEFSVAAATILLAMGVEVDDRLTNGATPFIMACKQRNLQAARFLLDNGADVNAADLEKMTGLYWACVHGDLELVKMLLEHRGAKSDGSAANAADQQPIVDVNTTTEVRGIAPYKSGGLSPLMVAIQACSHLSVQQVQRMKQDYAKKQENQMESEDEQAADNFEYLVTDRETIVSLLLPHVRDINQTTPGGESAMTMAVAKANPYVVQRILQTFAGSIKLDGVSESKQTLLHTAVGLNVFAYEVTKLLANEEGTKVNAFDGGGKTPLFRACESNNTDAALALLQAGADPSLGNGKQLPLHLAAQYHNAYVAHHLLEAGADVNATDEDGRNVLHLIFEGQLSRMRHTSEHSEDAVPVHLRSSLKNCLRLFGARGANVEQRDVIGNLPLAYALVFNHFSLVPAVLDMSTPKNLDLLAPVRYTHVMPVKPECQESDYDEYLHAKEEQREPAEGMSAEDKAKLGQVTRWLAAMREYRRRERSLSSFRQYAGESALHFFVKQGKLELVREVIGRLGDPREINTPTSISGDTALLLACRRQDTRMMELLLKNGADVNIANAQNQSPLHAVLQSSHGDPIASVSLLCDVEGVLIDNPDASGWTPLALAAQQGAVMSSLCLLNHGANIDAADKLGNTPLVQALVASHVTYGALLMQKGASLNTKVTTAVTKHNWIPSKRMMQAIQKHESSTLFDFAALRNYEGLCFLMLDIGMEGSQLFAAFQHLLQTGKYTLAQVLIKKYSASEERRAELRNLDVNALVGVISGLRVSNEDERYREWWQELVDRLLELRPADAAAGALVPDPSSNAKLPTLLAAEANHPQVLRYLTQQGLDFTVPGKDGETLLHIAARKNLPQVITAVIGETDAAADAAMEVEAEEDEEAERRKKEAELNGRNRKRLAAIINARNSGQQTALIRATHTHSFASYRNDKLLSALLTIQGIDVNAQDAKGNTALFYAVKTSADTCVRVLLAHGASPNIACERGETAVFVAARNNSSVIMEALLAKGADPHSINANGDRLLALCKPLAAAGLYHFVRSAAAAAALPTLVDLFPEFKPREGEPTDAVVTQLVGLVELLNEGLQLYSDRRQLLEELRQLVVAHLTSVDAKQSSRIPRNTKQLSFSSLSPEELAALKKKRKNEKEADADDEDEAEAEADDDGVAAKKAKVANGDQAKKEGQAEEEEEEVIEEPDIEIGDDIEQIPFPPPKKWTVKLAQRFVDDEFKRRYRAEASRVYLLWGADGRGGEDDDAEEKSQADNDDDENVGYLYDAKLNLCDISYGTYGHNKYYIIQAFGNRARPDLFYLWTRWARVGSYGFESQFQTYATKEEAIKAFEQKFRDKTKNNWRERADFQQAHDRYFYIPATHEIEDDNAPKAGVNAGDGDDASEKVDPACNLPGSVQSLLHLISNRKEFMHTYAAYGLRTAGLGSLTSGQIRNGFKLLKIISGIITFIDKKNSKGQPVPPRFRTALVELSNKYYSIIPYNFGRQLPDVISQTSQVSEQMRILESLADIDMGVQILAEAEQGLAGEGHVLEKLYAALHTQLTPVDKSSDEWLVVNEFMGKSGLSVLDAFAVEREGEAMRFRPFSHLPNRTLLAHGTRLANTMGILRQGLRIAPPEAPHSGYMFGKGIYFADVAEKSVGYCGLGTGEVGVFLLCEVALGNQYPCYGATYIEVLPRGKHSTLGCGRQVPSPSASIYTDEGVKIPLGREDAEQEEGAVKRRLTYNEHIVYNEGQVRIRYILKVRRG